MNCIDIFGDCSICLSSLFHADMSDQDLDTASLSPVVALPCGHCFHATCIAVATNTKRQCPNCRADIAKLYDDRVSRNGNGTVRAPKRDSVGCPEAVCVRPIGSAAGRRSQQLNCGGGGGGSTHQPNMSQCRVSENASAAYAARVRQRLERRRSRPVTSQLAEMNSRCNELKQEYDELTKLVQIGDMLTGGAVAKERDRSVLQGAMRTIKGLVDEQLAVQRKLVEQTDAQQRKIERYKELLADLSEAELRHAQAAALQQPTGKHHQATAADGIGHGATRRSDAAIAQWAATVVPPQSGGSTAPHR